MINVELLTDVQHARNVSDVMKVITKLAKPYGEIRKWSFNRDRERRVIILFVELERPQHHQQLAGRLGGAVQYGAVRIEIPQYVSAFDSTAPYVPAAPSPPDLPATDAGPVAEA